MKYSCVRLYCVVHKKNSLLETSFMNKMPEMETFKVIVSWTFAILCVLVWTQTSWDPEPICNSPCRIPEHKRLSDPDSHSLPTSENQVCSQSSPWNVAMGLVCLRGLRPSQINSQSTKALYSLICLPGDGQRTH